MADSAFLRAHCAHCPIRQAGMKRPRSIFAKIHRWHSSWWPAWRGYQADLRGRASCPAARATADGA
jgi:hypothetical protein